MALSKWKLYLYGITETVQLNYKRKIAEPMKQKWNKSLAEMIAECEKDQQYDLVKHTKINTCVGYVLNRAEFMLDVFFIYPFDEIILKRVCNYYSAANKNKAKKH